MQLSRCVVPALAGTLVVFGAYAADEAGPRVAKAEKVMDGKKAINVDVGHAAPLVVDWDGDGKKDLLVGQFGDGKLRIYINKGTDKEPKFDGYTYLQVGGKDATVPTG